MKDATRVVEKTMKSFLTGSSEGVALEGKDGDETGGL